MNERDRFHGCLLGLAVGDAVGTTLEFCQPGSFTPITNMVGGGPFGLQPGEWTDDTSMALCQATSLLEMNGFDARDQMERYCRWRDEGYLSSNGRCFDIGATINAALQRYKRTGDPFASSTEPHTSGNGSIMRLAPVVMFYYPDQDAIMQFAVESSRTTHASVECLDACRLLAMIILQAFRGARKEDIILAGSKSEFVSQEIQSVARGEYHPKPERQIIGSGYVVASLEAALWCFDRTHTFESAILKAANLGNDADTTAAVCGQIAGAFYGASNISRRWLDRLAMREEITSLADRLYTHSLSS